MNVTKEFKKLKQQVSSALKSSKLAFGFVESFCGPGGMSSGLTGAGFHGLYAFDIDGPSVETYNLNVGNHAEVRNAKDVSGEKILENLKLNPGDLPLFAGGPPCQGFSKQKKGAHLGDDRNQLVSDYIRLIQEIRPKFFFFENVAIFGQKRGKQYVASMYEKLDEYTIECSLVNSANFGLAQTRERFVIVGKRLDVKGNFDLPIATVEEWKTVGEVLGDLPEPPANFEEHPEFPNHLRARLSTDNIHRISHVPEGGGWQDIPYEYRLPCHQRVDTQKGGWPDVYGRLRWDGQCPTITGGFDSFSRGRYAHPKADRPLTPREAARLQGFPDDYVFVGTRGDMRKQIGNAVPPPLAEAVGLEILRNLLVDANVLKEDRPSFRLCERVI